MYTHGKLAVQSCSQALVILYHFAESADASNAGYAETTLHPPKSLDLVVNFLPHVEQALDVICVALTGPMIAQVISVDQRSWTRQSASRTLSCVICVLRDAILWTAFGIHHLKTIELRHHLKHGA